MQVCEKQNAKTSIDKNWNKASVMAHSPSTTIKLVANKIEHKNRRKYAPTPVTLTFTLLIRINIMVFRPEASSCYDCEYFFESL